MARQISDAQKAEAVARVTAGESKAAVARSLGVSAPTITNWINAAETTAPADPFAPPTPAEVASPATPDQSPAVADDVAPPATLDPVPGPRQSPSPVVAPAPTVVARDEVCGLCRPTQGVHPAATSFTCAHGTWQFAP